MTVEDTSNTVWTRRALQIARVLDRPMTATQIFKEAKKRFSLTPQQALNALAAAEGKYVHFIRGAWHRFDAIGRMFDEALDEAIGGPKQDVRSPSEDRGSEP